MIIYRRSLKEFKKDTEAGNIADILRSAFSLQGEEHTNDSEYLAWKNSLPFMKKVLDHPRFHDNLQIAVEYRIPGTSKRADFIIAGEDSTGRPVILIIELKQWSSAESVQRKGVVRTRLDNTDRNVMHPSYQANSYAEMLRGFNTAVEGLGIGVHSCVYLHNYSHKYIDAVINDSFNDILQEAPVFIRTDENALREYISRMISKPSDTDIFHELDTAEIRPAASLQSSIGSILSGSSEFTLIDGQRLVYETIMTILKKAIAMNRKFTVIVRGGAGTGKSVVAVNLLAEITRMGYNACYTTKNASPRNVYFSLLTNGDYSEKHFERLFQSPEAFNGCRSGFYSCILCDEAHRLVEGRSTAPGHEKNQIRNIINASLVSVFFIDEGQTASARDIGRIAEIEKWARVLNSTPCHNDDLVLKSQFRCNGSDEYITLVDNIVGLASSETLTPVTGYELEVFDDPSEMRERLRIKNRIGNKARMTAGYCLTGFPRTTPMTTYTTFVLTGTSGQNGTLISVSAVHGQ